jgi:saccharopine dehydrogenase (NAD+, L-lysine-forming)
MRVLVLGCGEMGQTAVQDLYEYGPFSEIVVATRSQERAEAIVSELSGRAVDIRCEHLDLDGAGARLEELIAGSRVVVNCIGPNYRYEVPVARAAIAAGVDLVDINDDYATTYEMLELHEAAMAADITVVLGLGASPGITNVLVRAAANQLDHVEEIRTTWMMCAADPGGPALSKHLIESLSDRALTVEAGEMREVVSFVDGGETGRLPEPYANREVFHIGHPEPITLWRTFPTATYVDDKATFDEPSINQLIRELGHLVREAPGAMEIQGRVVDPMDFAAAYLNRASREAGAGDAAALSVSVTGLKRARRQQTYFSSVGRLTLGTGIPASIGAGMIVSGGVEGKGVLPPEACIDPDEFIYELYTRRDVGELNGWVEPMPAVS